VKIWGQGTPCSLPICPHEIGNEPLTYAMSCAGARDNARPAGSSTAP
jgi:hypothetical protein